MEEILNTVDSTLEKIKEFTKLALISDAEGTVSLWRQELEKRLKAHEDPLPLLYCCNHILQESMKNNSVHEAYASCFTPILEEDIRAIYENKPNQKKQMQKVLSVWGDRKVFPKDYLKKLHACLKKVDSSQEDSEIPIGNRNNEEEEKVEEIIQDDDENEEETDATPQELQKRALELLPIKNLLSLSTWLEKEFAESNKFNPSEVSERIEQATGILESKDLTKINTEIESLTSFLDILKRRRRAIQGVAPAHDATQVGVINSIQQTEDDMQRASEDLNQCEYVGNAIQYLMTTTPISICEARYKSTHLIPKRQRVEKVVAQGVDLSFSQERKMKEGLTAEAAAQSQRPMIYHKGLQKWVPLPTDNDTDNWRD